MSVVLVQRDRAIAPVCMQRAIFIPAVKKYHKT